MSVVDKWLEAMKSYSPSPNSTSGRINDHMKRQKTSALYFLDEITNASSGKHVVMFLDYDGTLSPIVDNPDLAYMSDAMRETVRKLASCFPTAIVTGRCIDKVYDFVKLAELSYAGSHGMDIKCPSKHKKGVVFQPANDFLPMIDKVYMILSKKAKSTPGAKVENNKFCVSVHFRRVNENNWMELASHVKSVLDKYPKLRVTTGKKVLEIRPDIQWDKGKALEFLLGSLGYTNCEDVFPIYIGDDRSDEDAFKVLRKRGQGLGILVSEIQRDTAASYYLHDPSEVMEFLQQFLIKKYSN